MNGKTIHIIPQVAQVAAHTLGIDLDMINVKPSNNMAAPNNSVTGGSLTSESCAHVIIFYILQLLFFLFFVIFLFFFLYFRRH